MWLLNIRTAELRSFPYPTSVIGGYAILSHIWGEDCRGDTFQSGRATHDYCDYIAKEPLRAMAKVLRSKRIARSLSSPAADISASNEHRPPPAAPPNLPDPLTLVQDNIMSVMSIHRAEERVNPT